MTTLGETRRHFDGRASGYYGRNYQHPRNRHERGLALRREICLSMLDRGAERVLDLGCGPGALAIPLAETGRRVFAMDLSPRMAAEARDGLRAAAPAPPRVAVGDATQLPFSDGAFDAVVSTGVLEYVPDIDAALREIRRVLARGGVFVGTASLPRRFERWAVRRAVGLLGALRGRPAPATSYYHRAYTSEAFDELIGRAGMIIRSRRYSYFAPFPLDAVLPWTVDAVDRASGLLERIPSARAAAKTYIVEASVA